MRACPLYLGVAYLVLCALPVQAADLAKIERTIAKEPKYQEKPRYCLLVFGPEANFRVWLVLDGNILYADRNGNGDLTQPGARITLSENRFKVGDITNGQTTHRELCLVRWSRGLQVTVLASGKRDQWTGWGLNHTQPMLQFAESASKAPVVHFDGPLLLRLHRDSSSWRSGTTQDVHVELGTPGLGEGAFAFHELAGGQHPTGSVPLPTTEITFKNQSMKIGLQPNY